MVVIVISGQPGCGSSTLASLLAKHLRLRHFSLGKRMKKLGRGKETERAIRGFATKKGSSRQFHEKLDRMQVSIAKKGDVVIDSKLGIYFLKKYADFTVWIKSSSLARAKRVAKRDKLALKDAMRIMKEKERTERRFFKGIYGIDTYAQEKRADLSLDTTNKSPRQLAAIVIKALKKDKIIP